MQQLFTPGGKEPTPADKWVQRQCGADCARVEVTGPPGSPTGGTGARGGKRKKNGAFCLQEDSNPGHLGADRMGLPLGCCCVGVWI